MLCGQVNNPALWSAQDLELHPLDHWRLALKGPGVQKLGEEEARELNPLRSGVLANGNVRAKGRITCGGVYAELSKEVQDIPRPLGRTTLAGFEAILFKLQGGGKQYQAVLYTDGGAAGRQAYLAPFKTHAVRECNVRIPFSRFRPAKDGAAPLDPARIVEFGVRFLPPREALRRRTDHGPHELAVRVPVVEGLPGEGVPAAGHRPCEPCRNPA